VVNWSKNKAPRIHQPHPKGPTLKSDDLFNDTHTWPKMWVWQFTFLKTMSTVPYLA